jgi:isopentenyl diphosphate isomerase/L-lactate dehydrogenase-like FMN-dependent dehydrogenase
VIWEESANVADFERLAEDRLAPGTFGYYAGGAGDERTLRDNVAAYARWQLRPRVLVDVGSVSAATTVLGQAISMPVLVAPTALHRLAHPDGEPATARAAAAAGPGPGSQPTPAEFFSLVDTTVTWETVGQLAQSLPVPLVLKGIQTAEDAALACQHGAAAIVVSNHGGRQLDAVDAAIDLLPEVVAAVDGRLEVYVDGGVRRGTDVLVALALGARATLVGRPVLWGLAVGGEAGVRRVLELLREEVELGLMLLGTPTPAHVTRRHVARPSSGTPPAAWRRPPT